MQMRSKQFIIYSNHHKVVEFKVCVENIAKNTDNTTKWQENRNKINQKPKKIRNNENNEINCEKNQENLSFLYKILPKTKKI